MIANFYPHEIFLFLGMGTIMKTGKSIRNYEGWKFQYGHDKALKKLKRIWEKFGSEKKF
jgi:hypothetical protein